MTQLVINDVVNQIRQEIQIDVQGHGKASIRATARLAGVSDMALRKAFNSANLEPSELAIKLMEQGFSGANLNNWSGIGIPDIAVSTILEYFAFDAGRHCTEQAGIGVQSFCCCGNSYLDAANKGLGRANTTGKPTATECEGYFRGNILCILHGNC
jgi:hypothetical protein